MLGYPVLYKYILDTKYSILLTKGMIRFQAYTRSTIYSPQGHRPHRQYVLIFHTNNDLIDIYHSYL